MLSDNNRPETLTKDSPPTPSLVLTWPERVTAELVLFTLVWGVTALSFALAGFFRWWLVIPVALGLTIVARRALPAASGGVDRWWLLAVILVVMAGVFNASYPAEHLIGGRDSGTYLATAGWLAAEGTLLVDAGRGPMGEVDGLGFDVPGFYDRRGGHILEPQFMHAFPAMIGTLIAVGGVQMGLALNAALGSLLLLTTFALSRRLMHPGAALLTVGILGSSLVFVYYARAPFSEILMGVFVVAGIWLVGVAESANDRRLALVAGALVGAATLVRLDGIVLLLPATAYLLFKGSLNPELNALTQRARLAMNAVALFGVAQSLYVSPAYVLDRRSVVLPVLVSLFLVYSTHQVFSSRLTRWLHGLSAHKVRVFICLVVVFGSLLLYGWLVRPLVTEVSGSPYGVTAIQEDQEGFAIDETRSYAERSIRWVTWYQGPAFVVMAAAGMFVLLHKVMFGRRSDADRWLSLLALATFAVLYFWRPSINPDHIWAMRRYLTVVLPLGAVMAALGTEAAIRGISSLQRGVAGSWVVGAGLCLGLLVTPVATSARVWDVSELSGLASDFERACDVLGPDAHVLMMDDHTGQLGFPFAQAFRSYCGVPTAWGGAQLDDDQLRDLQSRVEEAGGYLATIERAADPADDVVLGGGYRVLELTISRPPETTWPIDLSLRWDHR